MRKEDAEKIAERLIREVVPDYSFRWGHGIRRLGYCSFVKKEISISFPVFELNNKEFFFDTLFHEISHAMVGKEKPSHGEEWRKEAKRFGAIPKAKKHVKNMPQKKYKYTCPECRKIFFYSKRINLACKDCCNKNHNGKFHNNSKLEIIKND